MYEAIAAATPSRTPSGSMSSTGARAGTAARTTYATAGVGEEPPPPVSTQPVAAEVTQPVALETEPRRKRGERISEEGVPREEEEAPETPTGVRVFVVAYALLLGLTAFGLGIAGGATNFWVTVRARRRREARRRACAARGCDAMLLAAVWARARFRVALAWLWRARAAARCTAHRMLCPRRARALRSCASPQRCITFHGADALQAHRPPFRTQIRYIDPTPLGPVASFFHGGLWHSCGPTGCRYIAPKNARPFQNTAQAFYFGHIIFAYIACTVLLVAVMRARKRQHSELSKTAGLIFIFAGMCGVIAMSSFVGKTNDSVLGASSVFYSWSFGLFTAAWATILGLVVPLCYMVA